MHFHAPNTFPHYHRLHTRHTRLPFTRNAPLFQAAAVSTDNTVEAEEIDPPHPSPPELKPTQTAHHLADDIDTPPPPPPPPPQQQQQLQPVQVCKVSTLPPQNSLLDATAALRLAILAVQQDYSQYKSGLIRLEVPIPRSFSALRWLRGQEPSWSRLNDDNDDDAAWFLNPRIFFSPRRSSAPETQGSTAAGAARAGVGSVAGIGPAWTWRGVPGQAVDDQVMASMRCFLETSEPRVRVFGGSRFDPKTTPAPEWEEFGSFFFVLPK